MARFRLMVGFIWDLQLANLPSGNGKLAHCCAGFDFLQVVLLILPLLSPSMQNSSELAFGELNFALFSLIVDCWIVRMHRLGGCFANALPPTPFAASQQAFYGCFPCNLVTSSFVRRCTLFPKAQTTFAVIQSKASKQLRFEMCLVVFESTAKHRTLCPACACA